MIEPLESRILCKKDKEPAPAKHQSPPPPPPPPPIIVKGTVLDLDFDGDNTPTWGSFHPGVTPPAHFTPEQEQDIADDVISHLPGLNIKVVINATSGYNYRTVIGDGTWGYGSGLTYIGSLKAGPFVNFVFPSIIGGSVPDTASIILHEFGHAAGLQHQSVWSGSTKIAEYAPGDIMGNPLGYGDAEVWVIGENSLGQTQDDWATLVRVIGLAP